MLSLRVLNEIIEKNRAWILTVVLWCWFVWKIFGGHLGQKTKLLKRFMHESPQRNYWKESCMNLSFVMLIFLEDIWRAFGTKKQNCWKDSCMNPHNTPNASLQQHSRPTMPFRLMAVLHCLRTRELLVKLLRIRWLGQPMAENRDVLAKK